MSTPSDLSALARQALGSTLRACLKGPGGTTCPGWLLRGDGRLVESLPAGTFPRSITAAVYDLPPRWGDRKTQRVVVVAFPVEGRPAHRECEWMVGHIEWIQEAPHA